MQIRVLSKTLKEVLAQANGIAPAKHSNPTLSTVLIKVVGDNEVAFIASNGDVDFRAVIDAEVTGERVDLYANCSMLNSVVKAAPADTVDLRSEEGSLHIKSGKFKTKLLLQDTAFAPIVFPTEFEGNISGETFGEMLDYPRYACATAEYQAIFRGLLLEARNDNTLRTVATDGFRLAYYSLNEPTGYQGKVVIPANSANVASKLISKENVAFSVNDHQFCLKSNNVNLNLRTMEGNFPDYERVIPSNFPTTLECDTKDFLGSLNRVATLSDKATNNRIDMVIENDTMTISAEGSYGQAAETISIAQTGRTMKLSFNSNYLSSAMSGRSGIMQLKLSGETSPSVLTFDDYPAYLAMVVPLRTG